MKELFSVGAGPRTIAILTWLAIASSGVAFEPPPSSLGDDDVGTTGRQTQQELSVSTMRHAINFVADRVQQDHYATLQGLPDVFKSAVRVAIDETNEPLPSKTFYFVLAKMLASMKDGHTHVYLKDGVERSSYSRVDLPITWLQEGLIVLEDASPARRGDRIVAIEGTDTTKLLAKLRPFISSENEFYLMDQSEKLLFRDDFLSYFCGLADNRPVVTLTLERNGNLINRDSALRTPSRAKRDDERWVRYQIEPEHSMGIFSLDKCFFNEEFHKTLADFMKEVRTNEIDKIVLDLRKNDGGDGRVGAAFLRYFKKDYRYYSETVRRSDDLLAVKPIFASDTYRKVVQRFGTNVDAPLFTVSGHAMKSGSTLNLPAIAEDAKIDGRLFLLASRTTFSSAHLFTLLVKDNKMGLIVGEPTGSEINAPGEGVVVEVPKTDFRVRMSAGHFQRPSGGESAMTLDPDYPIAWTRSDILNRRDPHLDFVRNL